MSAITAIATIDAAMRREFAEQRLNRFLHVHLTLCAVIGLLPLFTLWPLVYMTFFAVRMLQFWTTGDDTLTSSWIIPAHVLAFLTMVALLVIYELDLFRHNHRLNDEWRLIWAVLLAVIGPLAMLTYWWRHMRVA